MFLVVLRRSGALWDASRAMEEQSTWPAHASFMDEPVDASFIVLGGPLATSTAWCTWSRPNRKTPSAPRSRAIRGASR
jgi:hypothetical protein